MIEYFEYYMMALIVLPGLILAIIAQAKVTNTFDTYKRVRSKGNQTAAEVARFLLDSAGLSHIKVVKVSGHLTDHYNHKKKTVALSNSVHDSTSVAAIGIAAHEVGHAVQYKEKYIPIKIRKTLIPVSNFASTLLWPLAFIGIVFNVAAENTSSGLIFIWAGVIVFGLAALVNLVTLPVEFDASNRALRVLTKTQILTTEEVTGAKSVLNAAALTYVAAMLISVLNLIRFLLLFRRR